MGQCVSGPKPRRPDPVHDTQSTSWDSLQQPFHQVDLKMIGAILPLPAAGPTLEVEANDEGYSTLETVCGHTSTKKPVKRVTFNPQVQVREFERETHERIRLVIIPDSESDSLEPHVPPRVRVVRRKPRETVVNFKWDRGTTCP